MDGDRFDRLARELASGSSTRRGFLARAVAAVAAGAGLGGGAATQHAAAALCRSSGGICTGDGNCCSGRCLPKDRTGRRRCAKSLGEACAAGGECASGICADGVCCDQSCGGQCETCRTGTCTAVAGAPVGRAACAGSGACAGSCDGVNRASCTYPGAGVACGSPTCSGGDAQSFACDGAGGCATSTQDCGLYLCVDGACTTTCATDQDCIGAAYCTNGACVGDLADGSPCSRGAECLGGRCANGVCVTPLPNGSPSSDPLLCASAFAADGVCCDRTCDGQCEACNLTGSVGTCAPVSGAPVGGRPACPGGGSCVSGTCVVACGPNQRTCGGVCISSDQCCVDDDCGADPICQRSVCNPNTHACEAVPSDTDSRCVNNACGNYACQNGACQPTGIEIKPFSACFDYVCDPNAGWVKGPAKSCNAPGPCQTTEGAYCQEENLVGCVYPSTCATCQTCRNGTCVSNCADQGCFVSGVCNTHTGFCQYFDACGICETCVAGTCRNVEDGTLDREIDPDTGDILLGTCCVGSLKYDCELGLCPIEGLCCEAPLFVIEGLCCPPGTVEVCSGGAIGEECCPHACTCPPLSGSCYCGD